MSDETKKILVRNVIQVDSELLDNISHLIEEKADKALITILTDLHSADIAEIINHLYYDSGLYLFKLLNTELAGDVITEVDESLQEKIIKDLEIDELTGIIDELDTDDATDIVSDLPEDLQRHVLGHIDKEDSDDVKELLKYPEDTAGGIMESEFLFVFDDQLVKDAIKQVRNNSEEYDYIYQIYVVKKNMELVGLVTLKSLLINKPNVSITSIMEEDLIYVSPEIDQEEVANIIEKYDLLAIPVVNSSKQIIGRITIDDIVDVIHEEASEDIQKIAGLSEEQESSHSIFEISRIRLPWLIFALVMELINAFLLSHHEAVIHQYVIAAFFMPIIMAMGGSSGQQAAIVMVRGLTSKDIWLNETIKQLLKEFAVAVLNGIVLSSILLVLTYLFFHSTDMTISFSLLLSASLLIVILFATVVGSATPAILNKLGADPAIATGPFVSVTNDIVGMMIYFSIITMFFAA